MRLLIKNNQKTNYYYANNLGTPKYLIKYKGETY